MQVKEVKLAGLKVVSLDLFHDNRGYFAERFNQERFAQFGLPHRFVQDNHSYSNPKVLRGLHFQNDPAQGKLVGVVRGKIWDVVVDIRPQSPTLGQHFSIELSDKNGLLLWIPPGFAHGFCVLGSEPADVFYKVDALYNPKSESGICWSDPDFKIPWPVQDPVISARDQQLPSFRQYLGRDL
jgi:dTDP-4-dehydrorhamnose 3,5-epimerase